MIGVTAAAVKREPASVMTHLKEHRGICFLQLNLRLGHRLLSARLRQLKLFLLPTQQQRTLAPRAYQQRRQHHWLRAP